MPSACRCAPHCAELVLANLVLPWCRPDRVFGEVARVLTEGGAVLFATLGPDSLQEVRAAFAAVDDRIHVHAAFDMHDLGDLALAAGLAEPVLDVDRIEVTYARRRRRWSGTCAAVGAVNVAGGRRRSLTGRGALAGLRGGSGPGADEPPRRHRRADFRPGLGPRPGPARAAVRSSCRSTASGGVRKVPRPPISASAPGRGGCSARIRAARRRQAAASTQ